MKDENCIIHIEWDGPFQQNDLSKLSDASTDYGVYQIYGNHPVYGKNVLLYIGKAVQQTFSVRINQEDWQYANNTDLMEIYVGRLAGNITPEVEIWNQQIDLAEKLLIYSHKPAYNSMSIYRIPNEKLYELHILNWGNFNNLMPEVSGARWTNKYDDMPTYQYYGEHE